jgi:hypothetical protein
LAALQTDICSSLTAINASDNALKSYDLYFECFTTWRPML